MLSKVAAPGDSFSNLSALELKNPASSSDLGESLMETNNARIVGKKTRGKKTKLKTDVGRGLATAGGGRGLKLLFH